MYGYHSAALAVDPTRIALAAASAVVQADAQEDLAEALEGLESAMSA